MPLFVVETVQTFRHKYVIECKVLEHAFDTIVSNEASEFSQMHLGEQVITGREITYEEYDRMCKSLETVGDGTIYQPESGSPWLGRAAIHTVQYQDNNLSNNEAIDGNLSI